MLTRSRMNAARPRLLVMLTLAVLPLMLASCSQLLPPDSKKEAKDRWSAVRAKLKLELAQENFNTGQFDEARKQLDECLALKPDSGEPYVLLAKILLEKGQTASASEALDGAFHHGTDTAETDYLSGIISQRYEKLDDALTWYKRASTRDPMSAPYTVAVAETLVSLGRPMDALKLVESRKTDFEQNATLRALAGNIYMLLNRYEDAANAFRDASRISPDDMRLKSQLGVALTLSCNYQEAKTVLASAGPDVASEPSAIAALGRSSLATNDSEEAKAALRKLVEAEPAKAANWALLSRASIASNDMLTARRAATQACQLEPSNRDFRLLLGYVCWTQKDYPATVSTLEQVLRESPDETALYMLADCYRTMGQTAQARATVQRALEANPSADWARRWQERAAGPPAGRGTVPEGTRAMRAARVVRPGSARWRASRSGRSRASASMLTLGRMHGLALALLAVVALAATWATFRIEIGDRFDHQLVAWSTCGMLVCLAITMLLIGRHLMQRSLKHVEDQLRILAREDRLDPLNVPVPEELQATLDALEDYVQRVRSRTERLHVQKKELDVQMHRRQAERRHTEAIIFSISDGVLVIDTFGELALANHAAEQLFDFDLSESRHRPIERVIQDETVTHMIREARSREPDPGGPASAAPGGCQVGCSRQLEYSRLRDGKLRTFVVTLSSVLDEQQQPRGVVAIFHDVTRERELAQIKTDFVSSVSHELRTPLSSIKAYVEMLVDGEAGDEKTQADFYKIIEVETDRLQRFISKVLDISRIESGVMDIRLAAVSPIEVIREILDMMVPQAREHGIRLEVDLAEDLPPLLADRDLLYQAVQNVLSNAIKYTCEGGTVRVRTCLDAARAEYVISVADTGMGICQEDLPRVFDKFFRSREGSSFAKGTGLGLNLVKQIVETVHRGSIDVSSEHGVGSTFALRFPLRGSH